MDADDMSADDWARVNRDRDEEIFTKLVLNHGCGVALSVIAASGDAMGLTGDDAKNIGFVGLKLGGMSAAIDSGEDELKTLIDEENLWTIAFAATKQQVEAMIEALQSAVGFMGDIEQVRGVENIGDVLNGPESDGDR